MKKLMILILIFISNTLLASSWEFRTGNNFEKLNIKPWRAFPYSGHPIEREFEGFIEYRSTFLLTEVEGELGIYLGLIGDADKAFVNGVQIGQSGNFPPNFSYNMDSERTYFLPKGLLKNGSNEIRLVVYSKFLVNKGFDPKNFKVAPASELDKTKYVNELKNNLSKIIFPILCLVLTVVSLPLLAPKHLWNSQLMIFLIGLTSFILGVCRGRSGYHFLDMLDIYKVTLISSVLTIWLVTIFMTKSCKSWISYLPSAVSASLITIVLLSSTLVEAASWGRVWFHISPIFLLMALYGNLKVSGLISLRSFGLMVLIATNLNDNLNDLRIISTVSLLQLGLGIFIGSMIIDQLLGLKRSWEKYFMKEAQLEIDAEVGKQAVQIAHDLRSPLEALKAGISRIPGVPEDEHLNLNKGLARINEICNSLLRNEQTTNTLNSLAKLITYTEDVIQEFQCANNSQANIELHFSKSDMSEDTHLLIDPARFKRSLSNLINNSLEATNFKGKVLISVDNADNYLKLCIEDDGVGITTHPEFIFERGFTTKDHGNGLGLSSAKEFVENLGGKITVENLIKGTRITLFVPVESRFQTQNSTYQKEQSIVLIDDDPLVRFNWKRQGEKFGITVTAFKSFDDFLEKKRFYNLDTLIFIDSHLGSERGELLSETLSIAGYKKVFVTTGLPKKSLLSTKWIADVVGKSFESAVLTRIDI